MGEVEQLKSEISELKQKLREARQYSQKYHRRLQALEGPWIAKVEGARAWSRFLSNIVYHRPEHKDDARAFEAGRAVERENLLALLLSDHPQIKAMPQYWRDRIAATIRSGGKSGIEP